MDSNFPSQLSALSKSGIITSRPTRVGGLSGYGSVSHNPSIIFASENYPYDVTIYSVTRMDGKIEIQFKVACTFPNPPCPNVNYNLSQCRFSPDNGVTWVVMTPDTGHVDHDAGPFVVDETTIYKFIWDYTEDVPSTCVIEKYLVRIEVNDGVISNSSNNGIGSTDDFINVVYTHPENGKLYLGFIVNTFDTDVFCLQSVEWSRDNINWFPATNDAADPANSAIPRQTHQLNVFVWDWQKDTNDANNTCVRFSVYKLGATEPEIDRIEQIRFDVQYSNSSGVFYDGWIYSHGGGSSSLTEILDIKANIGGRAEITIGDSTLNSEFALVLQPGTFINIYGSSLGNNVTNAVIHSFIGNVVTLTTTLVNDENLPANCVLTGRDPQTLDSDNHRETFFRFNPTTYEVEYNHINVWNNTNTLNPSLDKDGVALSMSRQFSQSHSFLDEKNGNWVIVRGMRNTALASSLGSHLHIMYYNFEKKFWKVLFKGANGLPYPNNQQAATWVHDGWFYWIGGYLLGQDGSAGVPMFYRINIDSMYTGNLICEDLMPNTNSVPGVATQPVSPYQIGTSTLSHNPVTVGPGVYTATPSTGYNSFARSDARAIIIPNTNGKAIIPGGTVMYNRYQFNPYGHTIWGDSLIYDPVAHHVESVPLPNINGAQGSRVYAQNGAVVMVGGTDRLTRSPVLYTYDPCFNLWRNSGYPTNIGEIRRPFSAFDEANNQWYIWGSQDSQLNVPNIEGRLANRFFIQQPPTQSSGTKCFVFTNRADTWSFGPGEEFPDFNQAMESMVNFYHGTPLPGDQFLLGSGGPFRETKPLNFYPFRLNTNGHKIVIASKDKDNRITFTGDQIIPNNTFVKYIENLEPKESMEVWKSDWLKCKYTNTTWIDIYENGKFILQKNTLAEVEATPGSYFIDNDYTLYIHASDSSQIRINHLTFEATLQKNIFQWESIDETDKCQGINFVDIDIVHANGCAIVFNRYQTEYDSFDGFTMLNCRVKTNYASLRLDAALNGFTIKNCSFISEDNDRGEYSGHLDIGGVKDNIVFKQNYLWQWGNGFHIILAAIPYGSADVSDNIFINGDYPVDIACDDINFNRNILRAQNLNRPTYENLFGCVNLNFIGNAILGFEDFSPVSLYQIPSVVNVQNNTFWTDRGSNEILINNVDPLTELNFRMNIVALHGQAYDDDTLGIKEGNVYLVENGTAPTGEIKSRTAAWRNIFSRPFSYTTPIDALDIIPSDSIVKAMRRKIPTEPVGLDVTGANTPCLLSAGCIQAFNEHGSYKVESFRWLPWWVNECSMPDNILSENFYKLPNRKRSFVEADCIKLPKLDYQNKILLLDNHIGNQNYSFTLTLENVVIYPITVNLQTVDGTALAGTDYITLTQSVTFAPGETSKNITVTIIGDGITEQEENFFIAVSSDYAEIHGDIEVIIQDSGAILDADYLVIRMVGDSVVTGGDYMVSNTFLSDPYNGVEVGDPTYNWNDGNRLEYGGDDHLTEYPDPQEEEVLINVNNIDQNIFTVCVYGYWRAFILNGDRTITVKAFKGGTMSAVSSRWVNTGGTLIGETPGVVRNTTHYADGPDDGEYLVTVTYDKTSKRVGFMTQNNCRTGWADYEWKLLDIPMTNTGGSLRLNVDNDKSIQFPYSGAPLFIYCKFTPTQSGNYYIRTNNGSNDLSPFQDTELWWYDADRFTGSVTETDFSDDFYGGSSYSRIPSGLGPYGVIPLVAGTTYYLTTRPYDGVYDSGYEYDIEVRQLVPPSITSSSDIFITLGDSVNYQATATNGPVTWTSGTLPDGWTLNATSGQLSGVLSNINILSFTLTATNIDGPTSITVNIYPGVP